nr:transposase [Elizabethkingia anophelis]
MQWVMFGNKDLISQNIRHEQQKVIKYNHLVANIIILYNVITMTNVIKKLSQEELQIDAETLAATSHFRRENINRFGSYSLDMDREAPEIEFNLLLNY